MEIVFDIDGRAGSLPARVAEMIAENLRCYAVGRFPRDVAILTNCGVDPAWLEGAIPLAEVIEDTLVGRREGPIPLDSDGKAANALTQALRLTGPASFDATSEHACLLNLLREAQAQASGAVA
jgi:hypothetical protein